MLHTSAGQKIKDGNRYIPSTITRKNNKKKDKPFPLERLID
jgi:hypothetical protein